LGTNGTDQVFGIQFDRNGFPYVMGQTYSYFGGSVWPVVNAAWSQTGGKQFIAKLQPDLSAFVYSTTFGKGFPLPDISPVAFLVDRCENVYVSGFGGRVISSYPNAGVQNLPTTTDAIKTNPDISTVPGSQGDGRDFYFFVLKRDAQSQLYGSYFGQNAPNRSTGDHVDGGTSRFDQNGVIYQAICGDCGNDALPFPTTPPVWGEIKPASANCNLAMVKIAFDFAGVGSGVQSAIMGVPRDTAGCVPLTVDFRDTLLQAVRYYWNFGDGSPDVITNTAATSHTYTTVGQFRVRLIAEDSSTCNIRDTSYLTIRVGATQALPAFTTRRIDTCTALRYQFDNTSIVPPGFPFRANSFEWDFGDNSPRIRASNTPVTHQYTAPGTYRVRLILIDTTYCNSPDSVEAIINVASIVRADFSTSGPATGCAPYAVTFENTSSGGLQFNWDFGDGTTSSERSPTHTFSAGTWTVTLTAIDSGSCNIVSTKSFTITALGQPTASFTASPQPPIVNTPIAFTNQSSPDAIRFKWKFGDGDSLETTSRAVIEHEYNRTGDFRACLIAYNRANCPDSSCVVVRTLVEAALDVPNAFTPLSKDNNNRIFVRGFGIAKMRFTIWNRFGEKVFESNDRRIGWDGRYKGQLQPMDVYAYTLDVEFFDGTRSTKKGDITLIR
jgi:gliding motility-associated-like protein